MNTADLFLILGVFCIGLAVLGLIADKILAPWLDDIERRRGTR